MQIAVLDKQVSGWWHNKRCTEIQEPCLRLKEANGWEALRW